MKPGSFDLHVQNLPNDVKNAIIPIGDALLSARRAVEEYAADDWTPRQRFEAVLVVYQSMTAALREQR